jgi:hypothetical protein
MIHDLDKTLEKIFFQKGNIKRGQIDVSFEQPNGDWSARLSRPTINCWCYDMRENLKLRTMEMQVNRGDRIGQMRLYPRRIDLSYLVTAWARNVDDEHQLIWRGLGALMQTPVLNPDNCEGELREQPYEIPLSIANMTEHPISLTDLWSVLNNDMRLGFTFVITLALDTGRGFDSPLVLERRLKVGQTDTPSDEEITVPDVDVILKGGKDSQGKEGK